MKYIVGLDIGVTSIGWAMFELDENNRPIDLLDLGVRIFSSGRDAKTFAPTSVIRREKRGMRRNHERFIRRRNNLLKTLKNIGMLPQDYFENKKLEAIDPYELRNLAPTQKIELHHLGRAIFHLSKRRGFKSNRKSDAKSEDDVQGLKSKIVHTQKVLTENNITLGQYLYSRRLEEKPIIQNAFKDKNNELDNLFTSRAMIVDEFEKIMNFQQQFYPQILTDDNINLIKNIIFYQRPLKPQEVGKCTFEVDEDRAAYAQPKVQRYRIIQDLNNLRISSTDDQTPTLTTEMRLKIYDILTNSFDKVNKKDGLYDWKKIKKLIGIDPCYMFNFETEQRAGLIADTTSKLMTDIAPKWWKSLNDSQKEKAIDYILNAIDEDELTSQLENINAIEEQELAKVLKVKLKDGYGSVSIKFIDKVLPFLESGQQYSDACVSAGYNHSKPNETGEVFELLPYYGEVLPNKVIGGNSKIENINNPEKYFGKINNPTVHIALNQIRALLNDLTNRYGRPSKVNIEFAREVAMSATQKAKLINEQTSQKKENERINEILNKSEITPNSKNRMKYKIWDDLSKSPMEKCCPLSGKTISLESLFNGEFEIEHIVPFSRSYNDSRNNKMICSREMNAKKGNRTPYEMFIDNVFTQEEWDTIIARVQNGMPQKIKGFTKEGIPSKETQDFIARQLNDTRYMALVARDYVKFLVGENNVNSLKGVYTSVLRDKWGLNSLVETIDENNKTIKDRTKHHHHAVDAFVIALTGNNVINKLGRAFSKEHGKVKDLAPPLNNFNEVRNKLTKFIDNLVISHKYDHGISKLGLNNSTPGELHKETSYGHIVDNIYATREILTANSFEDDKKIMKIANPKIREQVLNIFKNKIDIKDYGIKLDEYCKKNNIKKVRIHDIINNPIAVSDKNGKSYKYFIGGNNFATDIWCQTQGIEAGIWHSELISNYSSSQKNFTPNWLKQNPTAMLIMRLQQNDMIALGNGENRKFLRVQKMTYSRSESRVYFIDQKDVSPDLSRSISLSTLKKNNARKIFISPSGKIIDPGKAKSPKNLEYVLAKAQAQKQAELIKQKELKKEQQKLARKIKKEQRLIEEI